jgi:hypothetical protein
MPIEFAVSGSGNPPELLALQDEWYQDVLLPDIGELLVAGIEWKGTLPNGGTGRLSLAGRRIFALAQHSELNGFVSQPRLVLGEEHVVLCVTDLLAECRAAIALTESPDPQLLNSTSGVPHGWVGLRGVRPRKPIPPVANGDILDTLRPLPDITIELTGGIRIDRQTWLEGFPPTIQLFGETGTMGAVIIDGQEACPSADGSYAVPGCDALGDHVIWCVSASRTYTIRGGAEAWEPWDAYAWSLGETTASGTQSRPGICGALVRSPRIARPNGRPTVVAITNPVLIGARPGEIEICKARGDVRTDLCIGFPWFEPIWAIPSNVLLCDKRTARVLLVGSPTAVGRTESGLGAHHSRVDRRTQAQQIESWCAAILASGRKGLSTEPAQPGIADLWKSYMRHAKALQRGGR